MVNVCSPVANMPAVIYKPHRVALRVTFVGVKGYTENSGNVLNENKQPVLWRTLWRDYPGKNTILSWYISDTHVSTFLIKYSLLFGGLKLMIKNALWWLQIVNKRWKLWTSSSFNFVELSCPHCTVSTGSQWLYFYFSILL